MTSPLLLKCPMPIYTPRLIIRPLMPGDGNQLFEAINESREQFQMWMPWVKKVTCSTDSKETARVFYSDFIKRKSFHLAVFLQDRLIGMCGFDPLIWTIPSGAIGYWCRKSAQGNGYIQEAISALILYGFKELGLRRLSILCNDKNIKSIQVAEKLGFDLETRALGLIENLIEDELVFGRQYVRFNPKGLNTQGVHW